MEYLFRGESLYYIFRIPAKVVFLIAAAVAVIVFYWTGFQAADSNLPCRTGIVDKVITLNGRYEWEVNFRLKGDATTVYWQGYDINYFAFLLYPPAFKARKYRLHKGDTIKFYVDKGMEGRRVFSFWRMPYGDAVNDKTVVCTEGLIVNGNEIASRLVSAFLRSPASSAAWLGGLLFCIGLLLSALDFIFYNDKS
ncbi:MAG: hypothetical protein ACFNM6_04495 [Prevotella sp.]